MKSFTIWLSYDLGLRGDYEGLYTWLDSKGAKECGNSIAYLKIQGTDINDALERLSHEIQSNIKVAINNRFYVISKGGGRFIIGGRKASPWEGYAQKDSGNIDK